MPEELRPMTLQRLREIRKLRKEIEDLENLRETFYFPVRSPASGSEPHGTTPGDPTARKAMKALERKESLENRERQLEDLQDRIEEYIDRMTDHHTAAIMRWHFIRGLTWRQTCSKVYGYPDPDICRMAVRRYFTSRENRKEGTDGTETD